MLDDDGPELFQRLVEVAAVLGELAQAAFHEPPAEKSHRPVAAGGLFRRSGIEERLQFGDHRGAGDTCFPLAQHAALGGALREQRSHWSDGTREQEGRDEADRQAEGYR